MFRVGALCFLLDFNGMSLHCDLGCENLWCRYGSVTLHRDLCGDEVCVDYHLVTFNFRVRVRCREHRLDIMVCDVSL